MKLRQLAIIASATLIGFICLSSKVLATTTLSAEIDSYTPEPTDIVVGSCSQIQLCSPDATASIDTSVFPFVSTNDSSFNVTSVTLTIDPDEDAVWSNGISDLFSNAEVSADGKSLTFSGGTIPVGAIFLVQASTSSDTPVGFSVSFQGEQNHSEGSYAEGSYAEGNPRLKTWD